MQKEGKQYLLSQTLPHLTSRVLLMLKNSQIGCLDTQGMRVVEKARTQIAWVQIMTLSLSHVSDLGQVTQFLFPFPNL